MRYIEIIILSIILSVPNNVIAQCTWDIDTLLLDDFKSSNVFIFSTKDSLYKRLGNPIKIQQNINIGNCDSMVGCQKFTSSFVVNLFFYDGMTYIERNNRVRLESIDFKLNDSVEIWTTQIRFNRNLKLKEMLEAFQLSKKENVYIVKYPFPPPWNYPTNTIERAYCIYFLTGEPCNKVIEIYFDKRKRLRYIDINPHYF